MNFELMPDHVGELYTWALKELHDQLRPDTYFEIGTATGDTLALADCTSIAVDPAFRVARDVVGKKPACCLFQLTSDEFFARHDLGGVLGKPVSMAFLDGMHHFEFLLRDFINTEKHCSRKSVVLLHDCLPTDLYVARRNPDDHSLAELSRHRGWWAGDVWKAAAIIRQLRPDLRMLAVGVPPTGLIAITNLDPQSRTLTEFYERGVTAFSEDGSEGNFDKFLASLPRISSDELRNEGWLKHLGHDLSEPLHGIAFSPSNIKISRQEDEALLRQHAFTLWPSEVQSSFLRACEIKPAHKAAVVVTMRDDGVSILQWVAHYRALGFEGIFVYSNDNRDGSEEMLRSLANAGVLMLVENQITGDMNPQVKAFEHSIRLLPELRDFEWVFYADSDEFLDLPLHGQNVLAMLKSLDDHFPIAKPSAICYRWKWFISGSALRRTPGLLLTRFQHGNPHPLFKSIVRLDNVVSMCRLHFPDLRESGFFVDSKFNPIPQSRNLDEMWGYNTAPAQSDGGYIRHYWTKSFEEFAVKKRRGDALNKLANNPYKKEFSLFFEWNGPEIPENKDRPDDLLVDAVEREIALLKALPGISELDSQLQAGFPRLLDALGGLGGLRAIYEECMVPAQLYEHEGGCDRAKADSLGGQRDGADSLVTSVVGECDAASTEGDLGVAKEADCSPTEEYVPSPLAPATFVDKPTS